jgi:hypothetical protein
MKTKNRESKKLNWPNSVRMRDRLKSFVRWLFTAQSEKRGRRSTRRAPWWRELQHVFALEPLEARLCLTPVANNDSYCGNSSGTTNIPASVGVLANDTGTSLSAILVSGPSHGSVTLNGDGSFA